jgi:uncharacterized protein YkwD
LRSLLALIACCIAVPTLLLLSAPQPAAAASRATSAMVAKVNQVRERHGLRPLRASPSLMRSSNRFSSDLMRQNAFGHRARVSASGSFRRLGECLAMHGGRSAGVSRTVREWLRSPGHRREVLHPRMSVMGVGITRGRFYRRRAVIWVLQVGKR